VFSQQIPDLIKKNKTDKMKKITYLIIAAALTTLLYSCDKFLDVEPQGAENSGNFFDTKENGQQQPKGRST